MSDTPEGSAREEAGLTDQGDGRNIDPRTGLLEGEGAHQAVADDRAFVGGTVPFEVWPHPASGDGGAPSDPTYYDRPVLKEPVWKWYVPAYFYCGGAAGAAAVLGAAAQIADRSGLRGLITRARWLAAVGGAAGTALLIVDLGRPDRFLNMLRVFRPTSPMNLGSWILSSMAPAAAVSALLSSPGGATGALGDAAGLASGAAGIPLAGYTAVLISNTAVPVWQQTRRALPPLFVSSAISAAASLLQLTELSDREARIVRRFAVVGAVGDLVSEQLVERAAGRVERVAQPLHEGKGGALLKVSRACTAASLALAVLSSRSRRVRFAAGILGTAGAIAVKFAITEAGTASAGDPRATFHQQRASLGGAEATGRLATTSPR